MNLRSLAAVVMLAGLSSVVPVAFAAEKAISPDKSRSLFNGRDLTGWSIDCPELDKNPAARKPFAVRDGLLVSLGTPGGHLVTDKTYRDYRLVVEYRFTGKGGNCGVLVHASKPRALYDMFPQSIEVQMQTGEAGDFWCICEDIVVPNMVERRGPRETWGVDGDKSRRIRNLTDDSEKPLGEWNQMVVECLDDAIRVWVNGDLVNDGAECTATQGRIALQAEGTEVEFRKIEIGPLGDEADGVAPPERNVPKFAPPVGAKKLPQPDEVWVDSKQKLVYVDGYVSLREGYLEMFACLKGTKEHEAVVAVKTSAATVHAALVSIGAKQGKPVVWQPKFQPPTGDTIEIRIQWLDQQGQVQEARAQDWIRDTKTKQPLSYDWVFAGSSFYTDLETGKKYYTAEGGDFICVSNFSTATLDLPIESSQSTEGLLFEANPDSVPELGTPVRLILSVKKPAQKKP
ncbi:MAG: DUF1080 domain-containing protein [Pirellulales bacterium]|nr:DUF1080 domain-containing protein [Pirellulales bacterium]